MSMENCPCVSKIIAKDVNRMAVKFGMPNTILSSVKDSLGGNDEGRSSVNKTLQELHDRSVLLRPLTTRGFTQSVNHTSLPTIQLTCVDVPCDLAEGTVIPVDNKDGDVLSIPNHSWRSNSSESDWVTTTDTSVHSSLSSAHLEVPLEVLEACDGMDEASCLSSDPSPRAKRKVSSRALTTNNRDDSSTSESSSSEDSESGSSSYTSSSYDTASSSSYSSSRSSFSSSSCSSSFCTDSSCSCSDYSSTSYESTDDLTDLPRAKTKSRRLGKQAVKKVADRCNQS